MLDAARRPVVARPRLGRARRAAEHGGPCTDGAAAEKAPATAGPAGRCTGRARLRSGRRHAQQAAAIASVGARATGGRACGCRPRRAAGGRHGAGPKARAEAAEEGLGAAGAQGTGAVQAGHGDPATATRPPPHHRRARQLSGQ